MLGFEGSEEGGKGKSPAGGVVAELGKVFLESKADVAESGAGRDSAADRFSDGVGCAMEGTPGGDIGIKSPGHVSADLAVAF